MKKDWDAAFSNSAHVANSAQIIDQWAEYADAYRKRDIRIEETRSGQGERETFDIVWPDEKPKGLVIFIHGGYWLRLDKSYFTHLAEGARSHGWVVCLVQYTLAPNARISQITQQVGNAINKAASLVEGPIRIAGHSAGGHLASRMVCLDTPLNTDVSDRVELTFSISGLHDLRPLMNTKMNAQLALDEAEACAESPALLQPIKDTKLVVWVGGGELEEFIRQAKLIEIMWAGFESKVTCVLDGDHHHFSVIDGLANADSDITKALLKT